MSTTYEAIRVSSGNSFVHETESQLVLSGSYDVNFTMDLVKKDVGLFNEIAKRHGVNLELGPEYYRIFEDGTKRYGERALSPRIWQRHEDDNGAEIRAPGFPVELLDDEPEEVGYEVKARDASGALGRQ